jgi:hypothetical protein
MENGNGKCQGKCLLNPNFVKFDKYSPYFYNCKCFRMDVEKNSPQVLRVEGPTDEQLGGHLQGLHVEGTVSR